MAEPVRLDTPNVTVLMADGVTHTVRVRNPDYLRWDRTAAKHGWPPMDKAPHTWLTFVAWSALRRERIIGEEVTWEAFSESLCLQVSNAEESPNGLDAVDPTPSGLVPG
jgi:hypothetical protein